MSSPLAKKGSTNTPISSRKKRDSSAINEPESSARRTKRTNGFAYLGNDQEELEELCHSFSVVADQRWRTPHVSTTALDSPKPTNVDGSPTNSTARQNNRMLSKLYSKPVPRNPLNVGMGVGRPYLHTCTPKGGVTLARVGLQPGETISPPPRRNDVEISYVNLLKRLRNSNKDIEEEMEISPHDPDKVVFYPPDYENQNMWSQVDFEEITSLEDEVAVGYYGTGSWAIDMREDNPFLWRSAERRDVPNTLVVGLRGGAGPAVTSSENDSSEVDGQETPGEAGGVSSGVESEDVEESTKEDAEGEAEILMHMGRERRGTVTRSLRLSISMNTKSPKGKEPEGAKSSEPAMQKSTAQCGLAHDHGAALASLRYHGHREQMTDVDWVEGMKSIDKFVFGKSKAN